MLIFLTHGFAFLANQKTGSSAFEATFDRYADYRSIKKKPEFKHTNYQSFCDLFSPIKERVELICCVREPLETLYSWYRFRSRDKIAGTNRSTRNISFEQFFEEWNSERPAPFADVPSAVDLVLDRKGNIGDILVFSYRGQTTIFDYAARKIGVAPEFKTRNLSPAASQDFETATSRLNKLAPRFARTCEIYNSINFANA
ncbi:MAG TPA: hypothetical protein ENJ90_08165 [Devosia sp.]|nr:hypothetical protein [Devosia sp.]